MKLVTWNCFGALHKKLQELRAFEADIMVIQECSQVSIEQIHESEGWSYAWFGDNLKKGLSVLVKPPWKIRETQALEPKWAGKLIISGSTSIELFPVWAHKSKNPAKEYVEQVHLLLDIFEQARPSPFAIVAGDFNSNSCWDGDYGALNHSAAIDKFRKLGLESAYHAFSRDIQGDERDRTHWNMKKNDRAYHIDYIFLSPPLLSKLRSVVVGRRDDWLPLSDHTPVIVELDL